MHIIFQGIQFFWNYSFMLSNSFSNLDNRNSLTSLSLKTMILRLFNWLKFHLMQLWYFKPSEFENTTYVSLGFPLFKSAGFIKFWYSKWKWRKGSHNVLILGLFRIVNLYGIPRIIVFTSGSETGIIKTSVHSLTIPTSFTQFGAL